MRGWHHSIYAKSRKQPCVLLFVPFCLSFVAGITLCSLPLMNHDGNGRGLPLLAIIHLLLKYYSTFLKERKKKRYGKLKLPCLFPYLFIGFARVVQM